MQRDWRSEAWRAEHPLKASEKFNGTLRKFFYPLRKLIGRFALSESVKYIDIAARWISWQNIEGDYCEFGVYTGRQFVHAYQAITRNSQNSRFFAFDSFEGLPQPEGVDLIYPQFSKGGLAATQQEFINNLKKHKVSLSNVEIVQGWYADVLSDELPPKIGLSKVAIALIDCDLYASTILALDFLTDLLVDGAIIIFDDWFLFRGHPDLGPQKAFREWQSRVPDFRFSLLPSISNSLQQAFIVHKPLIESSESS